jgi:hypothetical protein
MADGSVLGIPVPRCDSCGAHNEAIRKAILTGAVPPQAVPQLRMLTDPNVFRNPYLCPGCRRRLVALLGGGLLMARVNGVTAPVQISFGVADITLSEEELRALLHHAQEGSMEAPAPPPAKLSVVPDDAG